MHPDQARRRFLSAQVATLATAGPDGTPHIVPVTFAGASDLLYTVVDDKPKRTRNLVRLRNVALQPAVSVLVHHYADDWRQLWWVRADGTARIVSAGDDLDRAVEALSRKYPQYQSTTPVGPAIIVSVTRWSGWEATPA